MEIFVCRISKLLEKTDERKIFQCIPQYRKERADACKNEADRKRSLAASCLLYLCMKEQGVSILEAPCFSASGKMYFPQVDKFYVNLSHAGDFAVCACDIREIGVDIEEIRSYRESVVKRVGTEEEQAFFCRLNMEHPERLDMEFTKFWTQKESAVKLTGKGIAQLLRPQETDRKIFSRTYQPFEEVFLSISSFFDCFCDKIREVDTVSPLDFLRE